MLSNSSVLNIKIQTFSPAITNWELVNFVWFWMYDNVPATRNLILQDGENLSFLTQTIVVFLLKNNRDMRYIFQT